MKLRGLLLIALALSCSIAASQEVPLDIGKVVPKVVCKGNPSQSYAFYLPNSYSPEKPAPIIYVFDPAARGSVAVEALRSAAEQYGYILVSSNNSRNGPHGGGSEAANAVFQDTHQRFAIDDRRVYIAGFSGGARLATQLALACKTCIAGVIASGAGFPPGLAPTNNLGFAYFLAVGNGDFNFPETVELRRELEQVHATYRIRIFDGPHEWAPEEIWKDALRWMNLQAMRSDRMARNEQEIQRIFQQELEETRLSEGKGDILAAQRRYESLIRDFDGLSDVANLRAHASELKNSKAFRAAEKQERADIDRQQRLTERASSELQEIGNANIDLSAYNDIKRTVGALKDESSKASNPAPPAVLVTKRALGQLVVQAYEAGQRSLEDRNYVAALAYFDVVIAGATSPAGARYQRARAFAAQGDAKKCLGELRLAEASGFHDPAALDASEFKPYRQLPEFQALASEWSRRVQP